MDPMLAELAVSGAQTIVKLMTTDAWEGAKKIVARVFSTRPAVVQQQIMQDLDASRFGLAAASSNDPALEERERDRLEAILRLRLVEEPSVAVLISDILEFAKSKQDGQLSNPSTIVMKADARDHARVYQQGSGTQHNG